MALKGLFLAAFGIAKSVTGEEPQTLFLQGPTRKDFAVLLATSKEYSVGIVIPASRFYHMKTLAASALKILKIMFGNKLLHKLETKREQTVEMLDLLFKNLLFKDFFTPLTCTHQTLFNMMGMSVTFRFPEKVLVFHLSIPSL